ncbi:hypothetical protein N0V94_000334 [Neodidymelliopsis sp. IMI 364377]|nr:hypothetical protein N0V94_000334 [Neodidymelliopsis sp. IMI 364377]
MTAEPPGGRPHHGVNLGNLYRKTSPAEFNYTRGWAYFDDGSVYISSHGQSHDQFQQRMNIAARFIQRRSKVKDALEKKNSNQTQLIMIEQDPGSPPDSDFDAFVRYASDGETPVHLPHPLRLINFKLDRTRTFAVSTTFKKTDPKPNPLKHVRFLRNFRGTLVDGVLQYNVRLNNRLKIITDASMKQVGSSAHKTASSISERDQKEVDSGQESVDPLTIFHVRGNQIESDESRQQSRGSEHNTRNPGQDLSEDETTLHQDRQQQTSGARRVKLDPSSQEDDEEPSSVTWSLGSDQLMPTDALAMLRARNQGQSR